MKFKHLFLGLVAACAAFVGCEKAEQIGAPAVSVNPTSITFEKGVLTQEVQLTATLDWTATAPDWITLSATSGKASAQPQKITLSIEGTNTGNDKSGQVIFDIKMAKATLNVVWKGEQGEYIAEKGDGSAEKPYNVSQAVEAVQNLTWTDKDNYETVGPYYVKGKVVSIKSNFDAATDKDGETIYYGNAEFVMSDDGTVNTPQFTCYRIKYFGNKAWKQGQFPVLNVGDVVVFNGKLMYYGSGENGKTRIPETVNNTAYIISINGATSPEGGEGGDISKYLNAPESTIADFIAGGESGTIYKLTGKVSGSINATYGNFDLVDDSGKIYVYGVQNWADFKDKVKADSKVVVAGTYTKYTDAGGNVKDEIKDAYMISCEGGSTPSESDPKGTGTLDDPYNAAMAKKVASALESGAKTDSDVYVKGKIASIKYPFDAEHGTATFAISDDGSTTVTTFTCYSVFYLENKSWVDSYTQIAVGDEVIIYGKLTNYQGNTPETASKEAYIYSLNGVTEAGDVPEELPEIKVNSFSISAEGFTADWEAATVEGMDGYMVLVLYQDETQEGGFGYAYSGVTDLTSISPKFTDEDSYGGFMIDKFEEGVPYIFMVAAIDSEYEPVAASEPVIATLLPEGAKTLTIDLSSNTTFTADTAEDPLKKGFIAEVNGFKVGTYQYKSTTAPITPDQYGIRIYKSAVFYAEAPAGIKITSMSFQASDYSSGKYCLPFTEVETGSATVPADKTNYTIGPWTGSASKVILQAAEGQVRLVNVTITYVEE